MPITSQKESPAKRSRPSFLGQISLTGVKVLTSNSEETYCFNATLNTNGKPVCKVSNSGRGGSHEYFPLNLGRKAPTAEDFKAMNATLNALCKLAGKENITTRCGAFQLPLDLETSISTLVGEHLALKDHLNRCKRAISVHVPKRGFCKLTRNNRNVPPSETELAKAKQQAAANGYTILNLLSPDKLLELLYEAGEL